MPSLQATSALKAASSLLEWSLCTSSMPSLTKFCKSLLNHLNKLLPTSTKLNREEMWRKYHIFRTSKDFFILWGQFLNDSINTGGPIFFQYITDHVFKLVIKRRFPIPQLCDTVADTDACLSYAEQNALRYAAGYIPRNLHSKIKRSSHQNKESLSMCLMELIEEDGVSDDSEDWLKQVDRGGLNYINTKTYLFMSAMELVVKTILKKQDKPQDIKSAMIASILDNGDVQHHWNTLTCEWDPKEAQILLTMVTELWVTMRGFSYASAWLERHKAEAKKTVQKSKPLRKKIAND